MARTNGGHGDGSRPTHEDVQALVDAIVRLSDDPAWLISAQFMHTPQEEPHRSRTPNSNAWLVDGGDVETVMKIIQTVGRR
ncbi:protein of unknown function [Microbacterium sp. Nx66]|jgi:hypothetical protein|nr:protein of unknown function [Microbacterium sp. Nx66]